MCLYSSTVVADAEQGSRPGLHREGRHPARQGDVGRRAQRVRAGTPTRPTCRRSCPSAVPTGPAPRRRRPAVPQQAKAKAAHPLWARMTGELYDNCKAWPTPGARPRAPPSPSARRRSSSSATSATPPPRSGAPSSSAHDLASGVLLTSDHDGHGTYFAGNTCVDSAVDALPPRGNRALRRQGLLTSSAHGGALLGIRHRSPSPSLLGTRDRSPAERLCTAGRARRPHTSTGSFSDADPPTPSAAPSVDQRRRDSDDLPAP